MKKKQQGKGTKHLAMSKLRPAQIPRASPLPSREDSPILFEHSDQRPSADASDMFSFGVMEDELLDDSMSLIASAAEDLSGSTTDPAPLPSADPSDTKPGMDAKLFSILYKAVEELGLEWSTPEKPTRSRLESEVHSPLQTLQNDVCPRWTSVLLRQTGCLSSALHSRAPGLSGQTPPSHGRVQT